MSWLSFTARKWLSAALTIARRSDGRVWNVSHAKFLYPISTLQPKLNPKSCHFSCVPRKLIFARHETRGSLGVEGEGKWAKLPLDEKAAARGAVLNTAAPQGMALVCKQQRYASEAMSMSDQDDWEFAGPDDAKAEIRAAVGYLLRGAIGGARGDIVQEIIAIVRQVASGSPPG
jgi:hypothetical protein